MAKAPITLRRLEVQDVSSCCAILITAISGLAEMNEAARALIVSHATPALLGAELATYFTIVALDDRRVVGFGALDGDEIKRVYVDPRSQEMGVGRAVMRELEREALRRGLDTVRVTAGAEAAAFYQRLGYAPQGAGEFVAGAARVPFTTMHKDLRSTR